jgi:mannose-6-phosphate isomerase-like protein (cupin superfamily)
MPAIKSFQVFGERIDVLVDSSTSAGLSATIVQYVPPGGGPPPHSHANEDETFAVLEGEFEILSHGEWFPIAKGETAFSRRGNTHTFRNTGSKPGSVMIFITPGGFEDYLEAISHFSAATDMPKILEISAQYGITIQT